MTKMSKASLNAVSELSADLDAMLVHALRGSARDDRVRMLREDAQFQLDMIMGLTR